MKLNNFRRELRGSSRVGNRGTSNFEPYSIVRKRIMFSGRVQGVGFRYETYRLAEELNLTGWVRNINRDKVELEVQGERDDILFLVSHMKSLRRATVKHVEIDKIPLVNGETYFTVKYK